MRYKQLYHFIAMKINLYILRDIKSLNRIQPSSFGRKCIKRAWQNCKSYTLIMFSTINDVYSNVITNIQTQMDLSIKEIKIK